MSRVSKRRSKEIPIRRAFVEKVFGERSVCEGGERIGALVGSGGRWERCTVEATDVHEPLTRGRGGDHLDETNTLALCRACHEWTHRHPIEAKDLGLLK